MGRKHCLLVDVHQHTNHQKSTRTHTRKRIIKESTPVHQLHTNSMGNHYSNDKRYHPRYYVEPMQSTTRVTNISAVNSNYQSQSVSGHSSVHLQQGIADRGERGERGERGMRGMPHCYYHSSNVPAHGYHMMPAVAQAYAPASNMATTVVLENPHCQ